MLLLEEIEVNKMEEQSLALSFGDSITYEVSNVALDYAELGLDALTKDGLLKEIPIVSTVVSLYRIGESIREKHHVVKLICFLNQFNEGIIDEDKRQAYRYKFYSDKEFRSKELEYILVLVDRYISFDKPRMLAKLYLAYLDEKIIWEEFTMYAEVIDRFILLDYKMLVSDARQFIVKRNLGEETVLRLMALGLVTEDREISIHKVIAQKRGENKAVGQIWDESNTKKYKRTEFGQKLADLLR